MLLVIAIDHICPVEGDSVGVTVRPVVTGVIENIFSNRVFCHKLEVSHRSYT